ncbi:MAG: glycosyl hydrolase family 28-related protein [Verrucomicrobiota bacterium]
MNLKPILRILALLSAGLLSTYALETGDRNPGINCTYPPEAFFHNGKGGSVLDITKPPFNAKGDGVTDDTAAFVKAYDFILAEQDKFGYSGTAMLYSRDRFPNTEGYPIDGPPKASDGSFIIYIPDGEYLVSDTIIYSMPDRTPSKRRATFMKRGVERAGATGWERLIWVRFIGQSRDGTIIRLKDNAPGFAKGAEKAVLAYGKSKFNNRKGINAVRNLTINTGSGNPGAVALDFTSANKAQLRNLRVVSGDGSGACGILFRRPPVIGYHSDIIVEGFDHGIGSRVGHACAPVFEYVTLKNQKQAGIYLGKRREGDGGKGEAMLAARKIKAVGSAPAAVLDVEGGHLILTDSQLETPVQRNHGEYFLRNIQSSGDAISEKISGPVFHAKGQKPESLNLLHPEAPSLEWPSGPEEWATPEQFGAKADGETDDTAAIQKAFDSGKPFIFLPQANYVVSENIRVPASVRQVDGMFRLNLGLTFSVEEDSETPIRFVDVFRAGVRHACPRPVVLEMYEAGYANTEKSAGGQLYLLNGTYPRPRLNKGNLDVYGWSVNNEGTGLPVVVDNANSWIFGFKTERGPVLEVTNGASLEVLGATIGVGTPDRGAIINNESSLTLVANKSAGKWEDSAVAITETINGKTTDFMAADLPLRVKDVDGYHFIPMYTGRKQPSS